MKGRTLPLLLLLPPPLPPPPRRVPVKLPDFWQEDPETWFQMAEAQFRRGGFLDSRAKADGLCYYHAKYAERANKCCPPCSWAGNETAGGGN